MEEIENEFAGEFIITATNRKNEDGELIFEVCHDGELIYGDYDEEPTFYMVKILIKNIKFENAGYKIELRGKKAKELFSHIL